VQYKPTFRDSFCIVQPVNLFMHTAYNDISSTETLNGHHQKQITIHTNNNKAFTDIKLCSGIATALAFHASPYGPLWPNVTSSIKLEVHNASQHCQWRIEPRPQGICTKKFREDRSSSSRDMLSDRQTHRQTHRRTDRNTPLHYRGVVKINSITSNTKHHSCMHTLWDQKYWTLR